MKKKQLGCWESAIGQIITIKIDQLLLTLKTKNYEKRHHQKRL